MTFPFRSIRLFVFLAITLVSLGVSPPGTLTGTRVLADELPPMAEMVAPFRYHGGFFDVYWDDEVGRVLLEIDRWGDEFLMLDALASGLGSNPVGLDRGQLGSERLCRWKRVGRRVFLEQQNTRFRAVDAPAVEQQAVTDSFAPSILWGGPIVAAGATGDAVLVDVTSLVVSDRHDVIGTLQSTGQGGYRLAPDRSGVRPDGIKSFPKNVELEAWLTFTADQAGRQVRAVAASGDAFTLRQRISFIGLPDDAYQTRTFHPRVGSFSVDYADYASPLDRSMHRRLMTRHRLTTSDPIVYYVDPAAPEPIRSALVEGASWWADAFADAGFPGGFEVRVAPAGMDPLDARYNYIQWVHRQTRGWSYGASVVDPRTGEIIKGHVSLGSLRVRQDRLLIDNLTAGGPATSAPACACGMHAADHGAESLWLSRAMQEGDDAGLSTDVALARIRQLSAHEVGHTIGLSHNFAASTYGDRASVMDYPAPRIKIDDQGKLDFSDAYGVGMGEWDRFCIQAMYGELGDDPDQAIEDLVDQAIEKGWLYLSDSDARPASASDPRANLWDDGTDPVESLGHAMRVRQIGLAAFDDTVLLPGETAGDLRRYFAPLYFHHRYQVDAAVKVVGGVQYAYSSPGDVDAETVDVPVAEQVAAVERLIATIDPAALVVDSEVAKKLVPAGASAPSWSIELAGGRTDPVFDPLAIAETAAQVTLGGLLEPQRLGRLPVQTMRDENHPGFELVLQPLAGHARRMMRAQSTPAETMVARRVLAVIVSQALSVAGNENARQDVRAAVRSWLARLSISMARQATMDPKVHDPEIAMLKQRIDQALRRPDLDPQMTPAPSPPPGSPIGGH